MSTYCEENNIFINSEPVDDEDSTHVCETCIDNWDLSTWGIDEETVPDNEPEIPTDDSDDDGEEQPDDEEDENLPDDNCCDDADAEVEIDGYLENYDIKDI